MDYIPSRKLAVNQIFTVSATLAHNLGRELQMPTEDRERRDTSKRAARWPFKTLHTLRRIILRAGRLTRPEGKLTLTKSGNREVRDDVLRYVRAARAA